MSCGKPFVMSQCNHRDDYECKRKCNIYKLKNSYERNLSDYRDTYTKYIKNKYTTGSNKSTMQAYAEYTLKPKLIKLNNKLNSILGDLKQNIEYTNDLINKKHSVIATKNNSIYRRNSRITELDEQMNERKSEIRTKENQIDVVREKNNYKRNSMIILIIINMFILAGFGYFLKK